MRNRNRPLFERKLFYVSYIFYLHVRLQCIVKFFKSTSLRIMYIGIMGWFERIIGEKFGNKKNRIIGEFLGIICQGLLLLYSQA